MCIAEMKNDEMDEWSDSIEDKIRNKCEKDSILKQQQQWESVY